MSLYEITIELDSETRLALLRDTLDRIVRHTFGSSGEVTNILLIDTNQDPDTFTEDNRTCTQQAVDDHNEGVARLAGARTYTRTDGTTWTNPELEED